jgi:hypothetical protein
MRSGPSSLATSVLVLAGLLAIGIGEACGQTPTGSAAAAQPGSGSERVASVATPTGHEVSVSVGHYNYSEPGTLQISIHGAKFGGAYTGTGLLNQARHWFIQANARGTAGSVTYDGWCMPWLITPSSSSPNGYALTLGSASTCRETGDADRYIEGRVLVGKDLFLGKWGVSPESGVGARYLSNGTTGVTGYRTDAYLYVPVGVTARTLVAAPHVLSLNAEYDVLLHGRQTTRQSMLGGGDVPATPTAPAFTINGFTDLSFPQDQGWALRAHAKYQLSPRWSVEPSFIHWNVSASAVRSTTVTFTINGITAEQPLGAYEPLNITNEWSVNLGFHF